MIELKDIIIYSIGFLLLVFWLFLYFKGYKHAELFDSLDEKEFPLKEIYFVGYAFMELISYEYKSKKDRELRKKIVIYYGEKYPDYYLRVLYSQKMTLLLTSLVFSFIVYGFIGEIVMLIIMLVLSFAVYYQYSRQINTKVEERSEEMMSEFPELVSKLALLTNAGMILGEAWREIATSNNGVLYEEMRLTIDEIENGIPEMDAYLNFGNRSFVPEIKKFSSMLMQGIVKGNAELALMLQQQSNEVWQLKKQNVKRLGEKASSKLLLPISLMFVGLLIMIMVPIFSNLGV